MKTITSKQAIEILSPDPYVHLMTPIGDFHTGTYEEREEIIKLIENSGEFMKVTATPKIDNHNIVIEYDEDKQFFIEADYDRVRNYHPDLF